LFLIRKKFAAAKSQDYNYCRWGELLPIDAMTQSVFIASGCPNQIDPNPNLPLERRSYCTTCNDLSNSTLSPTQSPIDDVVMIPTVVSFLPIVDRDELITAVDSYLDNGTSSDAALQYGYPIGQWDVSQVSNFSNIFQTDRNAKAYTFNEDISQWNTSSAQSMSYMFAGAAMFRQDISSWSTSRVINMTGMCK
jgi:surface protein